MTLAHIVRAVGGQLYDGGRRASIPAPGHSPSDRSLSLLLSGDRVLIHGFGAVDWREGLAWLQGLGLVDAQGRLMAGGECLAADGGAPAPSVRERVAAAQALWREAGRLGPLALAHLQRRGVARPASADALREHALVPAAVYRRAGMRRPALLAGVRAADGAVTAVELTPLGAAGGRRKTVGVLPAGSAVRLDPAAREMLVAEGVFTALSASEVFGLPAWALLSAANLRRWTPPEGARSVLVAADRDETGLRAAAELAARLRRAGLAVRIAAPPAPFNDWNDAARGVAGAQPSGSRSG